MLKYCPECGEKLEGNPKFCSQCGNKLLTDNLSPITSKKIEEELSREIKPEIKKSKKLNLSQPPQWLEPDKTSNTTQKWKKPDLSKPPQIPELNKLNKSTKKKLIIGVVAIIVFIIFILIIINQQQQNNNYFYQNYYNTHPQQEWISFDTFEVNTYSDWHQFYPPSSGQWKISWTSISGEYPFMATIYRGTWTEPPIPPEYIFDKINSYESEKIYDSYETTYDVYTFRAGYYEGEQSSGGFWGITIWSHV